MTEIEKNNLKIVLDFVERWNKNDEEKEVAQAAIELETLQSPQPKDVERIKEEYWQMIYQVVDPFRSKKTKKHINEFVVCLDKFDFEEILNFFLPHITPSADIKQAQREAIEDFWKWLLTDKKHRFMQQDKVLEEYLTQQSLDTDHKPTHNEPIDETNKKKQTSAWGRMG